MQTHQTKKTFPEMYRTFADGELSARMERYGGIDSISLIDVLEFEGKPYPDRCSTPIFSRSFKSMGRPLSGSAVRLIYEDKSGRAFLPYPGDPEIFPWGARGKADGHPFEMLLDGKRVLFRCSYDESDRENLVIALSKRHLFSEERDSLKNQRVSDMWQPHNERAGVTGLDPAKPFPDKKQIVSWDAPCLDKKNNALVFRGSIKFAYGTKPLFMVITADAELAFSEPPSLWALTAKWGRSVEIKVAFGFGDSMDAALGAARQGIDDYQELWERKIKNCDALERAAPKIEISGMPLAGKFLKTSVGYQNAMLVGGGVGVRAASHKYAYFMMWDTIYPIRDFLLNGQYDAAKKIMRYAASFPYAENSVWISSQIVLALDEVLAHDEDKELLDFCWPYLRNIFEFGVRLSGKDNGLALCFMNAGVDNPEELGLTGLNHSSCVNGWWYGACRVMENLAIERGDAEVAAKARRVVGLIEKSYLKAFFSDKAGYLRTAVGEDLRPAKVEIFQNTSTLGLDYVYGQYLMRSVIKRLAAYQARKLFHPLGHAAVSWDSEVCCEMWKSVHMNQHLGHECKLARLADMTPEAYRVMGKYLEMFDEYKVAIETFNLAGEDGNASQTANWQTFSATAAGQAIWRGLAGVARHRGGLLYMPASDDHDVRIDNLKFKNSRLSVEITGKGRYVGKMSVNGKPIKGTMQLPTDTVPNGKVEWVIERSNKPFAGPVLLSAFDLPVSRVSTARGTLEFTVGRSARTPVMLSSPSRPDVEVDEKRIHGEWNADESVFWMDCEFKEGDRVVARL